MIHYFNFFRIHNVIMGAFAVLIAYYVIHGDDIFLLFHSMLTVVLAMIFGNILNDIIDLKPDTISHPHRSLPMNYISVGTAKMLTILTLMLLIVVAYFLPISACLFVYFLVIPILVLYNVYLKGVAIIGNIMIAVMLSSTFLFTELVFFNQLVITIIPSYLIFGLSLIREILKDIHDYDGDKEYKIYTLPVQLGYEYSMKIVVWMILFFCLLAPIPYYINYYSLNYFISLIILIEIPMIILVSLLLRNPNKLLLSKIVSMMKIINLFGLFVILIANK